MSLDSKIAQYSRSKAGAVGAPLGTGLNVGDTGLLAINFAGHTAADKAAGKVAIYSWDGSAWELLNDVATITTQTIDLTGGGAADIGAEYAVASPALTGDVVIGTYGSPAGAYLLTNKGAPTAAASWTALGSATAIASSAEASTGTDNAKMITSSVLRTEITRLLGSTAAKTTSITTTGGNGVADAKKILVLGAAGLLPVTALPIATQTEIQTGTADNKLNTPKQLRDELARALGMTKPVLLAGNAGISSGGGVAGEAGKFVLLDATGHIDASFLSVNGLNFLGAKDVTAAAGAPPAGGWANGDVYTVSAPGAPDASWSLPPSVTNVMSGDMLLYDGTAWHHLETAADMSHVVLKDHANAMTIDATLIWAVGAPADTVIFDGNDAANAVVQNVTLKSIVCDCGTF